MRRTGAAVVLFGDGDVMTSLRVLLPGGDLDMLIGVGGAMLGRPEPGAGGWWTTSLLSTPDHPALIVRSFVPKGPR